jgi:hypothetical protein
MNITCAVVATFLHLSLCPSLVMAPWPPTPSGRVCFYDDPYRCTEGLGRCCTFLVAGDCCFDAVYIGFSIDNWPPTLSDGQNWVLQEGRVWNFPGCPWQDLYFHATGYTCWTGQCAAHYQSGKWIRSGLNEAEPGSGKPCKEPDTLTWNVITEDGRYASWELPIANVSKADLHGPLLELQGEEKLIYLKSLGATFTVHHNQPRPFPNATNPSFPRKCG